MFENSQRGFSLIELMVVIALFTIITAGALMNHARFGEGILATNLAYDVALSFREAQSYGIAAREPSPSAGTFSFPYGLHFSGGDSFVFFTDRTGADKRYGGSDASGICSLGGSSECLKVYRFERGSRIESFCGIPVSGAPECRRFDAEGRVVAGDPISYLDITFKRPVPDATFVTDLNNAGTIGYASGRITIVSPRGKERRTVEVFQTGQISIRNQ